MATDTCRASARLWAKPGTSWVAPKLEQSIRHSAECSHWTTGWQQLPIQLKGTSQTLLGAGKRWLWSLVCEQPSYVGRTSQSFCHIAHTTLSRCVFYFFKCRVHHSLALKGTGPVQCRILLPGRAIACPDTTERKSKEHQEASPSQYTARYTVQPVSWPCKVLFLNCQSGIAQGSNTYWKTGTCYYLISAAPQKLPPAAIVHLGRVTDSSPWPWACCALRHTPMGAALAPLLLPLLSASTAHPPYLLELGGRRELCK